MKCAVLLLALFAIVRANWTNEQYQLWRRNFIFTDITYGMPSSDARDEVDEGSAHQFFIDLRDATEKDRKTDAVKYKYEGFYFGNAIKEIEKTEEFEVIKEMPKGSALGTEMYGALSTAELLIIMRKRKDLYGVKEGDTVTGFRYFEKEADATAAGAVAISTLDDAALTALVSVVPPAEADCPAAPEDLEANWLHFEKIRENIKTVVTHDKVFDEYVKKTILEFSADGVSYVEMRTGFDELHGLPNGGVRTRTEVAQRLLAIARQMKNDEVVSSLRFIYTPPRSDINYVEDFKKFNSLMGSALVGFDFDGRETSDYTLRSQHSKLRDIANFDKRFQFTAGNSLVSGSTEDENLMDAIIMGPDVINGGVSIINHPYSIEQARGKRITFLVDPIKYQYLGYGKTMKTHPISKMIGSGLNVTIAGGCPGMFGGKGVSHNYYYAMLAAGSKHGGIKTMKKFIRTGFYRNRMSATESQSYDRKWKTNWGGYCKKMSGRRPRRG